MGGVPNRVNRNKPARVIGEVAHGPWAVRRALETCDARVRRVFARKRPRSSACERLRGLSANTLGRLRANVCGQRVAPGFRRDPRTLVSCCVVRSLGSANAGRRLRANGCDRRCANASARRRANAQRCGRAREVCIPICCPHDAQTAGRCGRHATLRASNPAQAYICAVWRAVLESRFRAPFWRAALESRFRAPLAQAACTPHLCTPTRARKCSALTAAYLFLRRLLHAASARRFCTPRAESARATGARTPPSQAARTLRLLQAACDKRRAHSACRKWRAHSACCKRLAPRRHLTTATSLCHPGGAVPEPSGRCRRTNRRGRARGRRRSAVFQTHR